MSSKIIAQNPLSNGLYADVIWYPAGSIEPLQPYLTISIVAISGRQLIAEVGSVLRLRCPGPCSFEGRITTRLSLTIQVPDMDCHVAENIAKKIANLDGVHRVVAERFHPIHGILYKGTYFSGRIQRSRAGNTDER